MEAPFKRDQGSISGCRSKEEQEKEIEQKEK
jgi:hypothetical protein